MMISRFQKEADFNIDENNIHTFNNFWELEESIKQSKSSVGTQEWKTKYCSFDCVSTVKQLGGILPVSNDVTGDIYVNKLCALCHNVTAMTPWRMSVSCSKGQGTEQMNYMHVMMEVSKGSDFPNYCEVYFLPPYQHPRYDDRNFLDEDNLICIKSVYDIFPRKCNDVFELPLIYNVSREEIVAACENTSDPFEFGYGLDRRVHFLDKMCAICNGMYNFKDFDYAMTFLDILNIDFYQMDRPTAKEPSTEVCDRLNLVSAYISN